MRIEALDRSSVGDRTRIEARFVFEDAGLPAVTVYYEAGPPLAGALEATPEAFVLPAFPIALWEGERRLVVEGALDSTLASGLGQAAALLSAWHPRCGSLTLEPTEGLRVLRPRAEPRTVALISGGVDAMAMLRENRRVVPLDHPNAIHTGVFAFGFSVFDLLGGVENPLMRARYEAQAARLEALGEQLGYTLVRLDTNVLHLHPSVEPFYEAAGSGALLAPLVGAPGYVTDALIASDGEGGRVQTPHGSHPMLDVHYSTGAVRVHHEQPQVSRFDKLGLIADWKPAHDTLVVCHGNREPSAEIPNCGKCEKCIRTMVGLVAWKALPRFTTFPRDDVTMEMIDAISIRWPYTYLTMADLLAGLKDIGRKDLIRAIQKQVDSFKVSRWTRQREKWRRTFAKRLGRLPSRKG